MRSATTSYWSDEDGILREPILEYYRKLAAGGIGFIVKGHSYVLESGKAHTGQSGLTHEKHIPKMKELTDIVHAKDIPIIAQINHAGYTSKADRVTASAHETEKWTAREASIEDIETIIEGFANASEIAVQAGFDGVQIHCAHGYLLSQFLSDNVNKRTDKYGGSLENRARLLFEIFDAIKKRIGNAPIVSVKMNCDDFASEGGVTIADSVLVSSWLEEKGIDLIEISGGGPQQNSDLRKTRGKTDKDCSYYEANFAGHASVIRKAVPSTPLALVDGFRTFDAMEAALDDCLVDLISISKPTINDPEIPNKLMAGQKESECSDCRGCVSRDRFGLMMLACIQNE